MLASTKVGNARALPCTAVRPCTPCACHVVARKIRVVVNPSQRSANAPRTCVRTNAAAAPSSSGASGSSLGKTLLLGAMFAGWYAFNIMFNISNKTVLNAFPCPITCTTYQFLLGGIIGLGWIIGTGQKIAGDKGVLFRAILPLSIVHTLGNLLTNCSLGMVAVSFTHTIKAMEPFFSVVLSFLFLNDTPNFYVLLTLLPIVGGVALASLSEASFNWLGFATAMGSNVTFQSRNVLSKKVMTKQLKEDVGGSIGLFSLITILSFFLLAPVALLVEGPVFTPAAMSAMGVLNPNEIIKQATIAALTFHSYQQVSYMILSRVSPVTHSIGNCIKRIIVIVASVLFFRNPVTPVNAAGTALALFGVFAYSQVKRMTSKGSGGGGSD